MATWNSYVLTEQGEKMMAQAIAEKKGITITKVKASAHDYAGVDLSELTDLEDVKQEFKPDSVTLVSDVTTKISCDINNLSVTEEYEMKTIGVYAENGGDEVLFCVATAELPETMPAYSGGVLKEINAKIYITSASSQYITINIDMDMYVTAEACKDMNHPVGCVYLAVGGNDPATLFGGKWQKIIGRYIRASGSLNGVTYTAGASGGEITHTLTVDELPAHSHTRGTMNITGTFSGAENSSKNTATGAFYMENTKKYLGGGDSDSDNPLFCFDASKSWTGATSVVGAGKAIAVNPAYFVVDMWVRVA